MYKYFNALCALTTLSLAAQQENLIDSNQPISKTVAFLRYGGPANFEHEIIQDLRSRLATREMDILAEQDMGIGMGILGETFFTTQERQKSISFLKDIFSTIIIDDQGDARDQVNEAYHELFFMVHPEGDLLPNRDSAIKLGERYLTWLREQDDAHTRHRDYFNIQHHLVSCYQQPPTTRQNLIRAHQLLKDMATIDPEKPTLSDVNSPLVYQAQVDLGKFLCTYFTAPQALAQAGGLFLRVIKTAEEHPTHALKQLGKESQQELLKILTRLPAAPTE
jgi:hypothetical protein